MSQNQNLQASSPSSSLSTESSGDKQGSGGETGDHSDCPEPSPKQPRIESISQGNDLARCIGGNIQLSDAEKYELLANPFRPAADYKFPKSTTEWALSFQHWWFQLHPWLAYSKEHNGGFCTPCVIFASSGRHGSLHAGDKE